MKSNYSIIEVEAEEIQYKKETSHSIILRISTTLYNTYQLLYCTRHIQMSSNYKTIEVEAEEIDYKNETSHSIYLGFLLHHITLIKYYYILTHLDDK